MLPKYAELGHVYRTSPCEEYPGTYYVYHNGEEIDTASGHVGEEVALQRLVDQRQWVEDKGGNGCVSLSWSCSDNDPRIGQVWFTGFYTIAEKWI